jgi:small subunit ribosomal protein S4
MARYIEAKCRICRRMGEKLMLKGDKCLTKCVQEKRNQPPGPHVGGRRRKVSDRGMQLREKQKLRYGYGVYERQLRRTFEEATRTPGVTGVTLMILLERRLDNAVYRLGFADSRAAARQLVRHGHIFTNGQRTDVPSSLISSGDTIQIRQGSQKNKYCEILKEKIKGKVIPAWLNLDKENLTGKVISLPARGEIEDTYNEKMVTEYYSK